jgi:hypothetical protein
MTEFVNCSHEHPYQVIDSSRQNVTAASLHQLVPTLATVPRLAVETDEEVRMNHIEAHRLLELAEMFVIAAQPEFEHIRNCDDCSIAFLQLRDMLVGA